MTISWCLSWGGDCVVLVESCWSGVGYGVVVDCGLTRGYWGQMVC